MIFKEFPKIPRLSRDMVVTEKIDGTNAQIFITEDLQMFTGSRNRWITTDDDNFGFARWAQENKDELLKLGPGQHFGEWWGQGIQRGYGLTEKRFSLFNVARWTDEDKRPKCCHVVPVLLKWTFNTNVIAECLEDLSINGSHAAPGFMKPEGVVIWHSGAGALFKKTIDKDDQPKGVK